MCVHAIHMCIIYSLLTLLCCECFLLCSIQVQHISFSYSVGSFCLFLVSVLRRLYLVLYVVGSSPGIETKEPKIQNTTGWYNTVSTLHKYRTTYSPIAARTVRSMYHTVLQQFCSNRRTCLRERVVQYRTWYVLLITTTVSDM